MTVKKTALMATSLGVFLSALPYVMALSPNTQDQTDLVNAQERADEALWEQRTKQWARALVSCDTKEIEAALAQARAIEVSSLVNCLMKSERTKSLQDPVVIAAENGCAQGILILAHRPEQTSLNQKLQDARQAAKEVQQVLQGKQGNNDVIETINVLLTQLPASATPVR